jgi:hypothetical protein
MTVQQNTIVLFGALLLSVFVFYYTGSREGSHIKDITAAAEQQLVALEGKLENRQLKNAIILTAYAERLKALKPEFATLADQLASDAGTHGPAVSALKERLQKVKDSPSSIGNGSTEAITRELLAIQSAADGANYNNFLLENVNVIASLSGGALSQITPPSGQQAGEVGSQLVGNPQYGQWRQQNGMSIWEWYGAFSMLRDLVGGGRPYYYNDWARSPSFFNPAYSGAQGNYSSSFGKNGAANDNVRQEKTYGASQERRRSSYFFGSDSSSRRGVWDSGSSSRRSSSYGFSSGRRSSSFGSFRRK